MKKFVSLILAAIMCMSLCAFAVEDSGESVLIDSFSISEYKMALHESENRISEQAQNPLAEYKNAFDARAQLSEDELRDMGYTDEKIEAMKEYIEGAISFEEAASRASATLDGTITCQTHTVSKYKVTYRWEWDAAPSSVGDDAACMGLMGLNEENQYFVTKLTAASSSVVYQYYTGGTYQVKSITPDKTPNTLSISFPNDMLTDSGNDRVWAKSGVLSMTIVPAVSGNTDFAGVYAYSAYGHSTSSKDVSVTVSYNLFSGEISAEFAVSNGASTIKACDENRVFVFNDGSMDTQ